MTKLLNETASYLKCFQSVDSSIYVLPKPETASPEQLLQYLQVINGKTCKVLPGHEKDAISMEDLISAIRTHANSAVKKDLACTRLGEESAAKIRRTILNPILDLHKVCQLFFFCEAQGLSTVLFFLWGGGSTKV